MTIEMTLTRIKKSPLCTIGELHVANMILATLEPPERSEKPRCIPAGTYRITLRESPRLGYITPYLHDVPDFEDVLIHIGNFPKDTLGCVLVGLNSAGEAIEHSKVAFVQLMHILRDSRVTSISLTVV